jgi:hypothetical protein
MYLLPNFICPGAQKSATTSLHDILIQHPDVYLPECKETHLFDKKEKFNKGLDFYKDKFYSDVKAEKIIGDITPIYMYLEKIPRNINNLLGDDIKFVFMLRNPIERAYSHYWMSYRRGYETEPFKKAIKLEKERINKGAFERSHFSYIDRGFYSKQIKNFLKYFPKENMKFIIFDEFINNKKVILEDIFSFLNLKLIDDIELEQKSNTAFLPKYDIFNKFLNKPPILIKNIANIFPKEIKKSIVSFIKDKNKKDFEKPELNKKIKSDLINVFKPDVKELEKIIDKDLSFWFKI